MRKSFLPASVFLSIVFASLSLAGCDGYTAPPAEATAAGEQSGTTGPEAEKPSYINKKPKVTQQFGTPTDDWAYGVAVDSGGNIAIAGLTAGVLETGHVPVPGGEIFLAKFDPKGKMTWARQFAPGIAGGVAADPAGNLYVVGTSAGDLIVAKFDPAGNRQWQFVGGSAGTDRGEAIAVGPDNAVYVAGWTRGVIEPGGSSRGLDDIFVAKFFPGDNVPVWIRQYGSPGQDTAESIAVDGGGSLYVVGMARGDFEGNTWNDGEDIALLKLSAVDGSAVWARQYGTADDEYGSGVTTDGNGNVYITGYTDADLDASGAPAGAIDVFLAKIDPAGGGMGWIVQERSAGFDFAEGVAYAAGRLVVAGSTHGDLGGPNAGSIDAFLLSYDLSGNRAWTLHAGTASSEEIWSLAAGADGSAYAAGSTSGLLMAGEKSAGGRDAFLLKVDPSGVAR